MSTAQIETALTIGGDVVIALIVLVFVWAWRRTGGGLSAPKLPSNGVTLSTLADSPYIRGSDLYRRSYNHRNDTAQVRVAMGLPPQHNESMWRDPPR